MDITIANDGLGIYRKDTFTGQYTNFESFVPWRHKISWFRALIDRVHRICTTNKIKTDLNLIGKFLWLQLHGGLQLQRKSAVGLGQEESSYLLSYFRGTKQIEKLENSEKGNISDCFTVL